jgi:processive 1,2-diacylglycerol beta-glucosyltransferase
MLNKVEIYYATAGAGHKSAALAMARAYELSGAARQVNTVDVLDYTSKAYTKMCRKTYLEMAGKKPHLLGWAYDKTDTPWQREKRRLLVEASQSRRFIKHLRESDADLAVCTHFLPSELISWQRAKKRITTPQVVVVTDIDVHAMWLCHNVEHYFVKHLQSKVYLEKLGVPASLVSALGIPIDPVFAQHKDKVEMRLKHGLLPDRTTILVSAGGYGVGPMESMLKEMLTLKHNAQVVAICGRNEDLKRRVDAIARQANGNGNVIIHPVGFTKEMDEFMSASDLALGKPGGLTFSEAMAKGLAFFIYKPIPGQEERNSDHLLMRGAARRCNDIAVLAFMLDELIGNPLELARLQGNALAFSHPNAAVDIVNALGGLKLTL